MEQIRQRLNDTHCYGFRKVTEEDPWLMRQAVKPGTKFTAEHWKRTVMGPDGPQILHIVDKHAWSTPMPPFWLDLLVDDGVTFRQYLSVR